MGKRDEFANDVKIKLAARAGYRCSICGKPTIGPATDSDRYVSDGIAAHITAAATRGPRFDPSLTQEDRRSAANGIWACTQHAHEIDADGSAFSVDLLRGLKRFREEEAKRELQPHKRFLDQTAQLIEIPYATSDLRLFEIVAPQPYTFSTTAALRELIRNGPEPSRIMNLAAEAIVGVWNEHTHVAGILSILLSSSGNLWQADNVVFSKLEELCDRSVQSGDWSRIAAVQPLAFALGAKGSGNIHRRIVERLIEEPHWRNADGAQTCEYYGTVAVQIASIIRHWRDPSRNDEFLRVHDVPRVIDLLVSTERGVVDSVVRRRLLDLLAEQALAIRESGDAVLALRVSELVTVLRHKATQ